MTDFSTGTADQMKEKFRACLQTSYSKPEKNFLNDSRDNSNAKKDTEAMSNITREEIETKLQLIEERLDRKVSDIAKSVIDFQTANQRTVEALQNAKWWAIGTAIAVLALFIGTLQWGLSAQKEENARFSAYIREDVKAIGDDVKEISKAVTEMRIRSETNTEAAKN
ncbi:hypothetical protein ACSFEV_12060 [Pseudomonas fulva]|uniref:hypothetical protein n=1 Tax=Pseudomonas fulva TaxID=47880 RepID=UPI003EEA395F